jgi:AcrR family transcriptional regulator
MTRLTRDNWIQFGLKILKTEGYSQLKAGTLAKKLNVSRGSFYWHFEDLNAFHAALLAQWQAASEDVASALGSTLSPHQKLQMLMNATVQADFELEQAFRAWGREYSAVGLQIDQLDSMRLSVVQSIVEEAVNDRSIAESRAKFVYAAAIGLVTLGEDKVGVGEADLANIVTALLSRS